MKQKLTTIAAEAAHVHIVEAELKQEELEHEFAVPEGTDLAAVQVENLSGSSSLKVDGIPNENLSKYKRVKLLVNRIATETRSLVVKVSSKAACKVRITIAFFKKETSRAVKNFPCNLCKLLCRLAVTACLAYFGIPYLDAEATIDMPGIKLPDELPGGSSGPFPTDWTKIGVDPDTTISVQTGKPVPITEECKQFFIEPDTGPSWLRELFARIHPKMIGAVLTGLKAIQWFFDATDRIYTKACEIVGMCDPAASKST